MNRRTFLTRLTTGIVATAVLVHVPAGVIKAVPRFVEPARRLACERLRQAWYAYKAAHGDRCPDGFRVGREFYELYEGELLANERFILYGEPDIERLVFKGVPVMPSGTGYHLRVY